MVIQSLLVEVSYFCRNSARDRRALCTVCARGTGTGPDAANFATDDVGEEKNEEGRGRDVSGDRVGNGEPDAGAGFEKRCAERIEGGQSGVFCGAEHCLGGG